jgi:hypothetical protein
MPARPILFTGEMGHGSTAAHRARALGELGHEVIMLDQGTFISSPIPKLGALMRRFPVWPMTARFASAVLDLARRHDAGLIWFDKPILLAADVVRTLRDEGRYVVHFTVDDATGRATEAAFRNILACIPEADLSLVSRQVSLSDYKARGARDVRYWQLAYDDHLHRPPPPAGARTVSPSMSRLSAAPMTGVRHSLSGSGANTESRSMSMEARLGAGPSARRPAGFC